MEVKDFIENENKLKNLYYIYSADNYLRDEFKDKFIDKFVEENIRDFNLSIVQPGEDYFKKLSNAVQTPPLGSKKRFVISQLEAEDSFDKKAQQKLISIIENLDKTTCLLFLSSNSLDKRKKLYLTIKKKGSYFEFKAPKYGNLDKWIVRRFREHNKKIDKRSIKVLENMFSNKLEILATEIEKIITRFPDKEKSHIMI